MTPQIRIGFLRRPGDFVRVGLLICVSINACLGQDASTKRAFHRGNSFVGMMSEPEGCEYWQSKVDETLRWPASTLPVDEKDPATVMAGIECLLKMKGNKHPAAFSGAISLKVSQIFEPTTADVAALYYISSLYHQKWDHADAVAIRAGDGSVNTSKTIDEAFRAYKKWFQHVKRVGLPKAREMKLDPFKNTKLSWY